MSANFGRTPLHVALRAGEVDASSLAALAVHIGVADAHGFSPLYTAAMFGRVASIEHLVCLGANLQASDLGGLTPLHIAAEKGRAGACAALLAAGADASARDSIGRTPRDWAVAKDRREVLTALATFQTPSDSDAGRSSGPDFAALRRERLERRSPVWKTFTLPGGGGGDSTTLSISERAGEHIGSITWDGAMILLEYMMTIERASHETRTVLELGSGTALVGIGLAAARGDDVTCTDNRTEDLIHANVRANTDAIAASGGHVRVSSMDWLDHGAVAEPALAHARFDCIVGADILYSAACVHPLLHTIATLIKVEDRDCTFLLCYKKRDAAAEAVFFEQLTVFGFTRCEVVFQKEMHAVFAIAR